jgi:ABC-type dipeptide/oligopeptide/nickel transport system permease subunit
MKKAGKKLKKLLRAISLSQKATIGLIMILVLMAVAIGAPLIARYPIDKINTGPMLTGPTSQNLLGTDNYGRDVFSRVIMGTRVSIRIAFTVALLSILIGVPLGMIAGYFGKKVGTAIMRIVDVMLCFPWVMVALCVAALMGSGEKVIIISLVFAYVPTFVRLMHGVVQSVKEEEYVSAAKVTGESKFAIIMRYVLPNCLAPLIVEATLVMSFVVLDEAAISYLGVGVQPPTPSWGVMLNEGTQFIWKAAYLTLYPGFAIAYTVLSINLFGDGLRDILDPRYMGGLQE